MVAKSLLKGDIQLKGEIHMLRMKDTRQDLSNQDTHDDEVDEIDNASCCTTTSETSNQTDADPLDNPHTNAEHGIDDPKVEEWQRLFGAETIESLNDQGKGKRTHEEVDDIDNRSVTSDDRGVLAPTTNNCLQPQVLSNQLTHDQKYKEVLHEEEENSTPNKLLAFIARTSNIPRPYAATSSPNPMQNKLSTFLAHERGEVIHSVEDHLQQLVGHDRVRKNVPMVEVSSSVMISSRHNESALSSTPTSHVPVCEPPTMFKTMSKDEMRSIKSTSISNKKEKITSRSKNRSVVEDGSEPPQRVVSALENLANDVKCHSLSPLSTMRVSILLSAINQIVHQDVQMEPSSPLLVRQLSRPHSKNNYFSWKGFYWPSLPVLSQLRQWLNIFNISKRHSCNLMDI